MIRAWRFWRLDVDNLYLMSISRYDRWVTSKAKAAVCSAVDLELIKSGLVLGHFKDVTPFINCTCGIYAYKLDAFVRELLKQYHLLHEYINLNHIFRNYCFGEVDLWGSVIEHNYGYRAQFAKIRSLFFEPFSFFRDIRKTKIFLSNISIMPISAHETETLQSIYPVFPEKVKYTPYECLTEFKQKYPDVSLYTDSQIILDSVEALIRSSDFQPRPVVISLGSLAFSDKYLYRVIKE